MLEGKLFRGETIKPHLHEQFFLDKSTCQGKLASGYSRQVFLDKWTCQGKIARVNGA